VFDTTDTLSDGFHTNSKPNSWYKQHAVHTGYTDLDGLKPAAKADHNV